MTRGKDELLKRRRAEIIRQLPERGPIFLPTEKISLEDQVAGLERVLSVYQTDLKGRDAAALRELRARYQDYPRCFVIGNGPSLNKTDLARLKGEVTFAVNGFFLKQGEIDWVPTFYVVEDHLVAEDRAFWINNYSGPVKMFPANLAYCLDRDERTIFFDLRSRVSYPDGFDFSVDASDCVYAGGTVIFSCLQIAAYLGFREINLIGVDADYTIPPDAQVVGQKGVSELDMLSDDQNHFDPNYFGKGFRWHDPNVSKMIAAFAEARKVTEVMGLSHISNATIGGKLEVFPRVQYDALFEKNTTLPPRTLVIDFTAMGGGTATGELKSTFLRSFAPDRLLHLYSADATLKLGSVGGAIQGETDPPDDQALLERVRSFDPDVILYRPVADRPALHDIAMRILCALGKPWVIWIMDDWPERLRIEEPSRYPSMDRDLRFLLEGAADRFAISVAMADAFQARYGVAFKVFHNGVDPDDWPAQPKVAQSHRPIVVRYAGSLAPHMTRDSVWEVAQALSDISKWFPLNLEIRTQSSWLKTAPEKYADLPFVSIFAANLTADEYRRWISEADIVILAYNFDKSSINYSRYSFANKMPELLASGSALLAYGPRELATIEFLANTAAAVVVGERNPALLRSALEGLVADHSLRDAIGARGRAVAFERLLLKPQILRFFEALAVASGKRPLASEEMERDDQAQIDESGVVFEVMKDRPAGVMIDVGAHFGSSLANFADRDWQVLAFEPDPSNREQLRKRFGARTNVIISEEAVSDAVDEDVPFYASDESTGISGLLAFRGTHQEVARVKTTTLDEVVVRHALAEIDFLKIDVEGFEMAVLRGLDFTKLSPRAILTEYEDRKTKSLGYDVYDLCKFLVDRRYTVYVSEWYPIQRYGVRHSFRRISKYPCSIPSDSWGNLIAFRDNPPIDELKQAIRTAANLPIHFEGDELSVLPVAEPAGGDESLPTTRVAAQAPEPTADKPKRDADLKKQSSAPSVQSTVSVAEPASALGPVLRGQVGGTRDLANPGDVSREMGPARTRSAFEPGNAAAAIPLRTSAQMRRGVSELPPASTIPAGRKPVAGAPSPARKRRPKEAASTPTRGHPADKAKRANRKRRHANRPRTERIARRSRQGLFQNWPVTIAAIGVALVLLVVAAGVNTSGESSPSLILAAVAGVAALVMLGILHDSFKRRLNANRDELQASTRALKARAKRREKSLLRKLKRARKSAARGHAETRKALGSVRAETRSLKTALGGQVAQVRREQVADRGAVKAALEAARADVVFVRSSIAASLAALANEQQVLAMELAEAIYASKSAFEDRNVSLTPALGEQRATMNEVTSGLGQLRDRDVSLDIVSALRALRGLIFPNARGDTAESREHGHFNLMIAIANEFGAGGQSPSGQTLIEIGTTRERLDTQSSTEKLAIFTGLLGMRFVTVDMDPANTARARRIIRQLNPSATAVTAKGEDYLAAAEGPFDYVYLDAFDFDHGKHSETRQNRYRENLGINISDEACWQMHLECARHIAAKMRENGIVVIDDTWTDNEGAFVGKGKFAVPFLLASGFSLVSRTAKTVTLRREQA